MPAIELIVAGVPARDRVCRRRGDAGFAARPRDARTRDTATATTPICACDAPDHRPSPLPRPSEQEASDILHRPGPVPPPGRRRHTRADMGEAAVDEPEPRAAGPYRRQPMAASARQPGTTAGSPSSAPGERTASLCGRAVSRGGVASEEISARSRGSA